VLRRVQQHPLEDQPFLGLLIGLARDP